MPLTVNHLGQLPAITISFNLEPGIALSDAVHTINETQREIRLPATVQTSFQGTAQAFQESTSSMTVLGYFSVSLRTSTMSSCVRSQSAAATLASICSGFVAPAITLATVCSDSR